MYAKGDSLSEHERDQVIDRTLGVLQREARWGEEGTDPALAYASDRVPEELYWASVRKRVPPNRAIELLSRVRGSGFVAYGSGQGIVGAAAAISWPARRKTWEVIAYRPRDRWGSDRSVDARSVQAMSLKYRETFLSWDPAERRLLVTPHTPCPILFGVRGRKPGRLLRAAREICSEKVERQVLFETNQGTGDHVYLSRVSEVELGTSPALSGRVASPPRVLRGGHVSFGLSDGSGEMPCIAFEPGKALVRVVRRLAVDDLITVWGSVAWDPPLRSLRLEGMEVLRLAPRLRHLQNPRCSPCGISTHSLGKGKGYRCDRCRRTYPPEAAKALLVDASDILGVHLPTESARRHLSPLPGAAAFARTILRPSRRPSRASCP